MMLSFTLVVITAGILTAFVAGNNLSAAVGMVIGGRIVTKSTGLAIGIAGFLAGLYLQGADLRTASEALLPHSYNIIFYALLISSLIFAMASFVRAPLSLIMALLGAAVGLSLHYGHSIDIGFVRFTVLTWVIAPVVSIASAFALNRALTRHEFKDSWRTAVIFKVLLIIVSFFTAFTLGANTLGFIDEVSGSGYLVLGSMTAGIIVGSVFLSSGVIKRVGQEIYLMRYTNAFSALFVSSMIVEAATFFGIPVSNTQTLTSSVFGTGISYKFKAIYLRPFLMIVITWAISPVAGFVLGWII